MDRTIDFRHAPEIVQTCIGRVDDAHKTIVREDGSLNYGFDREVDLEENLSRDGPGSDSRIQHPNRDTFYFAHRLKPTFTHSDDLVSRTQEYGDPAAAVVTTTEEYEDTTFTWTTFGYETDDLRADVVRFTLEASDDFGHAPSRVEFELTGEREGLPTVIETAGNTDYWTDEAFSYTRERTQYAFLESGETREGALVVVLEGDLDPETVTLEWADDALAETRRYWERVEPFRNEFRIPDDAIAGMLESCGRNILQAREEVDGVTEYQVGPTHYRGLWIVDGHFLLEAAHLMGRGDDAFEQGILSLLRRVKPNGSIQILPGHDKETGIALATFVRQCELAADDERLRELWPTMRRARRFLQERHDEAAEMGEDYPASRLFPPAFLDGGIGGPFPDYTTPLWILVGLKHAHEAGERLDLEGYEAFGRLFEDVLAGFEACAERDTRETDDGIPYVPMNMVERDYDNPQSATWAFAHAIYPGEVFDPDSPYVRNLLALLESVDDTQGIPENTGWLHDQGVWGYSGLFYAEAFLYAGRPETAVDYLYAFANHAAPNRAWREETSFTDSHAAEFVGDMPHNWASAEFVRLVRNLLVFERQGTLELLPGLPDEWLPTADEPLVLEATPTRYGDVDLRLSTRDEEEEEEGEGEGEGYELTLDVEGGNRTPDDVLLHWDGDVATDGPLEAADPGVWRLESASDRTIRLTRPE